MAENRTELYYGGRSNLLVLALVHATDEWASILERVTIRPGTHLVHGGTRPALLHFPITCVGVDVVSPTGAAPPAKDDTVAVAMHGPLDMVGVQALLSSGLSSRRTIADHGGQALRCSVSAARRILDASAGSRELILGFAGLVLEESAQQCAAQQRLSVLERTAAYLLRTVQVLGEASVPVTHIQLATRLGARRPSVTESLQALEKSGVLRQVDRGRVEVLKLAELSELVERAWPGMTHARQAFTGRLEAMSGQADPLVKAGHRS